MKVDENEIAKKFKKLFVTDLINFRPEPKVAFISMLQYLAGKSLNYFFFFCNNYVVLFNHN